MGWLGPAKTAGLSDTAAKSVAARLRILVFIFGYFCFWELGSPAPRGRTPEIIETLSNLAAASPWVPHHREEKHRLLVTGAGFPLIKGVSNNGKATSLRTVMGFPVTRWSLVAEAAGEAEASLEALCRQYWQPVYAVARLAGNDVETAKDLTQGFFAKLLEKGWLADADRGRGRFRTFLVTALKRYMVNEWQRAHAAKRGGFAETVPLDAELAERLCANETSRQLSPDEVFDRRWALALLDAALRRLGAEYPEGEFAVLKGCLTAGRGETDYAELARRLATSEGAARVAVHRLRKRYCMLIRDEVARTVSSEKEVEPEMQALMAALT